MRSLEIYRNGVAVLVLPKDAKCMADDELRSPQDIEICPLGNCEWGLSSKVCKFFFTPLSAA